MPNLPRPKRRAYLRAPRQRRPTSDQAFYSTQLWKKVRSAKLDTNPLCQACEAAGRIPIPPARPVDHVIPITLRGAAVDMRNLCSLCDACHDRKSALERHRGILVTYTQNENCDLIPRDMRELFDILK